MPDVSDTELAELRAARDARAGDAKAVADAKTAAAKAAADAKAAKDAHEAELGRIRAALADPATVRQLAQQHGFVRADSAPAPTADDDPDAIVSRRDLARASEQTRADTERIVRDGTATALRGQRALHKAAAAGRLRNFDKYAADIDTYLDKLAPEVAASATAYDEVYAYVRSKNFDAEVDEEVARRAAPPQDDADGDATDPSTEAASARPAVSDATRYGDATATPRREPPIVGGQANARMSVKTAKSRLTPIEEHYRERMGLTVEEWAAAGDYDVDFLDMKGRERV